MIKRILLSLLLFLSIGPLSAKEIVLASMNYPPFYGEELKHYGPLIEIITKSYQKTGYEVKITFVPWVRALAWSKTGKVDGMVGVWYSPERAQHYHYSAPIFPNKMGFYKRKDEDIQYRDYADLKQQGYRLGSVRGYIQPTGLAESGIPLMFVSDDSQSFKILSRKRVDLVVVDKDYARYMLAKPEFKVYARNIQWMEPVLEEKQQHLIISLNTKQSKQKLQDFNKGLAALRLSGEFSGILKKHGF